jgi:hypothetical protein
MTDDLLGEFVELTEVEQLRKANSDLQNRLRKAKAKSEDLVAAVMDGSRAAMLTLGPTPRIPVPARDRRRR